MNKIQKTWVLLFGTFTAIVVVLSQFFLFQPSIEDTKKEQTTKAESTQHDSQEAYFSLTPSSPPSPQPVTEPEFSIIEEILFKKNPQQEKIYTISYTVGRFFHTLFRTVIVSNAP